MPYSITKDGITQSLLSMFMTCPKQFDYATKLYTTEGLYRNTAFGSFWHALQDKSATIDGYKFHKIISAEEAEYMRAVASVMIPLHASYYAKSDARYSQRKPEFEFDVLFNGIRLRGKIDETFTFNKKLWFREVKTKSRYNIEDIELNLHQDWQTTFYALALKLITGKAHNLLYDVIRYPKRKFTSLKDFCDKLSKEVQADPAYYFQQRIIEISDEAIDEFAQELDEKLMFMRAGIKWKNQCACLAGYGCDYLASCKTGDMSGLIRKQRVFEELSK